MRAMLVSFLLVLAGATSGLTQQPPQLWQYDLSAPSFGSAAVGDIDADGLPEIVFGTYFGDEHAYALNGEDGSLKWDFDAGGGPLDASCALADVNLDGNLEVLVAASWGIQYCLDGEGNELWRFPPSDTIECIDSPPAVADVDNDGLPEVIFGAWHGKVYVLNGEDGSLVWEEELDPSDYIQSQPAILDVDDDGQLDIVVASFSDVAKVYALRGNDAHPLWEFQAGGSIYHGPSFADIDEDGRPELAFSCYDSKVYVLNAEDGSELWTYPVTDIAMYSPVALADLDNDGHLELAATGDNLYVLSHTGGLEWSTPVGRASFRGPTVADVDGDGWLELAFGSDDRILRVLKGLDGTEVWSWELDAQNYIDHAPTFADFDGDGDLDLFFVAGYYEDSENHDGWAYAVDTGDGSGPGWPMFAHDLRHSGSFVHSAAFLYRSAVNDLAPGWKASNLPLTSLNQIVEPPFPLTAELPGSTLDSLATSTPLTLYRLLAENDTPVGNRLLLAKGPVATRVVY